MLGALVVVLLAQAPTELPPVPKAVDVDETPTAFACSWEVALRGDSCAFEAIPTKGDARANARSALAALSRACAEATADERLQRACEDDGERVARSPACARDDVRLADDRGHLVQKAADCAEGLRRVLARTRRKAALDADCLGDDCPAPATDDRAAPTKATPTRKHGPARKQNAAPPNSDRT
jgi:hypothetical protein